MRPILVFCLPAIGDFIRCHSAIQIIAARFPGHPIDVVTSPIAAPLARLMPHVRKAWIVERHWSPGLRERARLARELRHENYQTAYLLTSSTKAALVPWLAGIPERIGYPRELQFGIVNRLPAGWLRAMVAFGPRKTRLFEQVCAVAMLGEQPGGDMQLPQPRMVVPPEDLSAWRVRHGIDAARPALALYTSEFSNFRSWPAERFISIAKDHARRGWSVWIVGGPREREAAARIRAALPEAVDFTSTPDIADAMCQIAASTVFLGVDGGICHAAAALRGPCVLIFGSNRSYETAPVNDHVRFLEPPVSTPSWVRDTRGVSEERVLAALADAVAHTPRLQGA
ncbi:lipopolysaccharide heptosyltransferase II [Mesorhizobium sp. M1B.F.Ca.ET.045.04.1.1]|uniref:lipopolysaccharide heptosyltransferase II n=1 Tax=Mesorhizobium sp. M1B.F.Ca.ET.045.04.1.1 TaxID=2493673 RepID=UPI000F75C91E|nr:lipopolysaccharide heptosyltransferase II [Mesorhizobium sp. M1B.F.Ca.ET.045.04.1.1]AZO30357.1 lipopolysaccharide heptosyltransferase II [Mesorhizobium sp. M1B.F.Ca.ET.045.04.1.1]